MLELAREQGDRTFVQRVGDAAPRISAAFSRNVSATPGGGGYNLNFVDEQGRANRFIRQAQQWHRQPVQGTQKLRWRSGLSRRTVVASVLILLMIPVTLVVCVGLFGRTHYYITALLVMLECMLPFFMVFEGRRPQAGS